MSPGIQSGRPIRPKPTTKAGGSEPQSGRLILPKPITKAGDNELSLPKSTTQPGGSRIVLPGSASDNVPGSRQQRSPRTQGIGDLGGFITEWPQPSTTQPGGSRIVQPGSASDNVPGSRQQRSPRTQGIGDLGGFITEWPQSSTDPMGYKPGKITLRKPATELDSTPSEYEFHPNEWKVARKMEGGYFLLVNPVVKFQASQKDNVWVARSVKPDLDRLGPVSSHPPASAHPLYYGTVKKDYHRSTKRPNAGADGPGRPITHGKIEPDGAPSGEASWLSFGRSLSTGGNRAQSFVGQRVQFNIRPILGVRMACNVKPISAEGSPSASHQSPGPPGTQSDSHLKGVIIQWPYGTAKEKQPGRIQSHDVTKVYLFTEQQWDSAKQMAGGDFLLVDPTVAFLPKPDSEWVHDLRPFLDAREAAQEHIPDAKARAAQLSAMLRNPPVFFGTIQTAARGGRAASEGQIEADLAKGKEKLIRFTQQNIGDLLRAARKKGEKVEKLDDRDRVEFSLGIGRRGKRTLKYIAPLSIVQFPSPERQGSASMRQESEIQNPRSINFTNPFDRAPAVAAHASSSPSLATDARKADGRGISKINKGSALRAINHPTGRYPPSPPAASTSSGQAAAAGAQANRRQTGSAGLGTRSNISSITGHAPPSSSTALEPGVYMAVAEKRSLPEYGSPRLWWREWDFDNPGNGRWLGLAAEKIFSVNDVMDVKVDDNGVTPISEFGTLA